MPKTNPEARERLVATAADMLRRRCLNATSIRELAKAAKAPLGSTYHYFPDGKKQVVTEAIQYAGAKVSRMLEQYLQKGPLDGIKGLLAYWREVLIETEYQAGCPVIAAAMEDPAVEEVALAQVEANIILNRWCVLIAGALKQKGVSKKKAENLALAVLASAEGAIAITRIQKSIAAYDAVCALTLSQIKDALAES